ncbi:MAG: tRNA (adenosine(37)-N6)-threonylcarbamoyltransferase complex ATPase subunit type 1 TsaE [Acidobacteriota bacterium]
MASSSDTELRGEELGRALGPGDKVLLVGPLGAGKTTLVKGVARAHAVKDDVTSPTFTLIHTYQGARGALHHVDLYRIDDPSELEETGLYEIWLSGDPVLCEWGDKLPPGVAREATLRIELLIDGDGRVLRASGRRGLISKLPW